MKSLIDLEKQLRYNEIQFNCSGTEWMRNIYKGKIKELKQLIDERKGSLLSRRAIDKK